MSVVNAYLSMLNEAKKKEEDKLDPVGQADADIDNDGDVDDSDEYLHKRRKAIKKSMKEEREECPKCEGEGCEHCDGKGYHEAVEIDPDDGEVTKKKDDKKKASKKGEEEKVDMNEAKIDPKHGDQEKMEPRAKGEKDFVDDHKLEIKDRPDAVKQDGADKVKQAPARPGDNKQGDKLKSFKDIRK
jgi:hypothetical protein